MSEFPLYDKTEREAFEAWANSVADHIPDADRGEW